MTDQMREAEEQKRKDKVKELNEYFTRLETNNKKTMGDSEPSSGDNNLPPWSSYLIFTSCLKLKVLC
jgi:hypothetical protein